MGQVPRGEHLAVRRPVERVPFTRADGGVPGPSEVYATRLRPMTYDLHMGGNMVNTAADTHREELPSILIYGDSFTNAVECVAYLSFGEMCSLYLCYYHEMSLEDYIRAVRPDIVVCIRDYARQAMVGRVSRRAGLRFKPGKYSGQWRAGRDKILTNRGAYWADPYFNAAGETQ